MFNVYDEGNVIIGRDFTSIKEAKEFIKAYKSMGFKGRFYIIEI